MTDNANIRIGIAGFAGRMGQAIYEILPEYPALELTLALSRSKDDLPENMPDQSQESLNGQKSEDDDAFCIPVYENVMFKTLGDIDSDDMPDVILDFTRPAYTIPLLKKCIETNTALVTGTTGFSDIQLSDIRVAANKIPVLVSANMSLGVNVVASMLSVTGKSLYQHSDVEIIEAHHRHKVDAPSGTAKLLGQTIAAAAGVDLESKAVMSREGDIGERETGTIGFSTIRGGDVVGEHTVIFYLAGERIELTHRATNRNIFARGACLAAEFLANQPAGLYSMQDVLALTQRRHAD